MKVLAVVAAALVLAPVAEAKFRIRLALSPSSPRAAQPVRASIRVPADAHLPTDAVMRLVAVPPRIGIYPALRVEERYRVPLDRDGDTWTGTVTFGRPGRWRLVVPNWGAPGYAIPPPVIRAVSVRP